MSLRLAVISLGQFECKSEITKKLILKKKRLLLADYSLIFHQNKNKYCKLMSSAAAMIAALRVRIHPYEPIMYLQCSCCIKLHLGSIGIDCVKVNHVIKGQFYKGIIGNDHFMVIFL